MKSIRPIFSCFPIFVIALALLLAPDSIAAQQEGGEGDQTPSAGMMRFPDVSTTHIVFSWGGDLWVVEREGGVARPLASPEGTELFPRFNSAGDRIAFTGNYDGDQDLYVVNVEGGIAERLTWHPGTELFCDWAPDGSLIFSSSGYAGLQRMPQLFRISIDKPFEEKLPVPYGSNGAISDDGKWLAYTPHSRDTRTWKRYRGGMASDVWLFNLETSESKRVTDWEGTDTLPMWHRDKVYYLSDSGDQNRLNIWEYDPASERHRQVTDFDQFDCKWPSIGPGPHGKGEIILQNGANLWLVDLESGERQAVDITIPGDQPEIRRKTVNAAEFIQAGGISPTGKRVIAEARGDIWTAPVKKGSPRNLTRTSGVAERMPAWSPDGQWIAYFSDKSGEYELYIMQSDGRGETKQLTSDGKAWRYNPLWSPDSKHIAFTDKAGKIFLHTIESAATKEIDADPYADPPQVSWSYDSGWLTWARASDERAPVSSVYVYNIANGETNRLTNFFNCSGPVFDRKGDYILCSSNRAFTRPQYEDVGTTFIYAGTEVLLAIPLRADVKQPLLPESDEETWGDDKKKDGDDEGEEEEGDDEDKDNGEEDDDDDDGGGDGESDSPASLSGSWTGRVLNEGIPEEIRNFTMNLQFEDDGSVTGSINSAQASLDITSGTYDADSGEITLTASGGDMTVSVTGKIEEGKFTGTGTATGLDVELELEATRDATSDDDDEEESGKEGDDKKDKKDKKPDPVKIEFDGIELRIFQLPIPQGNFGGLAVNDKNHIIYARRTARGEEGPDEGGNSIRIFDLKDEDKAEKTVVEGGGNFELSADGKKLFVARGDSFYVVDAAAGQKLSEKISTDGMKVSIDPREEWRQVFMDAWRIERDFFYDPTMHGVDWVAIRDRYANMIDDCMSRADLGFLIGEMISELNVGHAYYRPSADEGGGPEENVGMLGCRFEIADNRYRIAEIHEGAPWDTDARNPLRAVGVKEGEFILAVNGIDLDATRSPWSAFVGLANLTVTLTVSEDAAPDENDRQVPVKLLDNDNDLRFRAWIEENRKYVDEQTNGRVGYIYVINTGMPGQNDLFRQFHGQASKEALIIDDRWNGGGQIPTRFIELLNRPVTNYWAKRDGRDWTWPPDSHQGPKCMLINGMAGSGGDMFPALFRQAGLGKLVGMRTWGGLVGISGNPQMIDGSGVTAPTFAYYEADGTWGIEGHGVDPDVPVIDDPAKMVDGGDPQLDAAIKLMLTEIKEHGYKAPERPKYPDRRGIGISDEDK